MFGFVAVSQTAHVLPIALAFFGIIVCLRGGPR